MFSIINSKLTINKTMDNKGIIYYKSIPAEIKKLGLRRNLVQT